MMGAEPRPRPREHKKSKAVSKSREETTSVSPTQLCNPKHCVSTSRVKKLQYKNFPPSWETRVCESEAGSGTCSISRPKTTEAARVTPPHIGHSQSTDPDPTNASECTNYNFYLHHFWCYSILCCCTLGSVCFVSVFLCENTGTLFVAGWKEVKSVNLKVTFCIKIQSAHYALLSKVGAARVHKKTTRGKQRPFLLVVTCEPVQ